MNKKILLIVLAVILIITGFIFAFKFKNLKQAAIQPEPANENQSAGKDLPLPAKFDIDPAEGAVASIDGTKLTLITDSGQKTINLTSEHTVFLLEDGKQTEKNISDIQKGAKVKVVYAGPVTPENNYIASSASQGTVTAASEKSLTVKTEAGEKTLEIIPATSVYLLQGEKVVDKKTADIKVGSTVTVAYSEEAGKAVAVAIQINEQ
jgi:hypothetical protein